MPDVLLFPSFELVIQWGAGLLFAGLAYLFFRG